MSRDRLVLVSGPVSICMAAERTNGVSNGPENRSYIVVIAIKYSLASVVD